MSLITVIGLHDANDHHNVVRRPSKAVGRRLDSRTVCTARRAGHAGAMTDCTIWRRCVCSFSGRVSRFRAGGVGWPHLRDAEWPNGRRWVRNKGRNLHKVK